ncbi:MAG: metalloregulator ArsR/SmtB family transcription factor [bacterium]
MDLQTSSAELKVLADPTRVRLLALLRAEELTVAELAEIMRLAQPRVSTHLAKLKDSQLVKGRRSGVSSYYRFNSSSAKGVAKFVCEQVLDQMEDPLLIQDQEQLKKVLAQRASKLNWADKVAGDMERHYSPGRTWESTARTFAQLLNLGDVLDVASGDGAISELLAPHAQSLVCADISKTVLAACNERLKGFKHVSTKLADMHALPFADQQFDLVFINHGLTYSNNPNQVFAEVARVLKPGGKLLLATLNQHQYVKEIKEYDHVNHGFSIESLKHLSKQHHFKVETCRITSREQRQPHFEVVTLLASLES